MEWMTFEFWLSTLGKVVFVRTQNCPRTVWFRTGFTTISFSQSSDIFYTLVNVRWNPCKTLSPLNSASAASCETHFILHNGSVICDTFYEPNRVCALPMQSIRNRCLLFFFFYEMSIYYLKRKTGCSSSERLSEQRYEVQRYNIKQVYFLILFVWIVFDCVVNFVSGDRDGKRYEGESCKKVCLDICVVKSTCIHFFFFIV